MTTPPERVEAVADCGFTVAPGAASWRLVMRHAGLCVHAPVRRVSRHRERRQSDQRVLRQARRRGFAVPAPAPQSRAALPRASQAARSPPSDKLRAATAVRSPRGRRSTA